MEVQEEGAGTDLAGKESRLEISSFTQAWDSKSIPNRASPSTKASTSRYDQGKLYMNWIGRKSDDRTCTSTLLRCSQNWVPQFGNTGLRSVLDDWFDSIPPIPLRIPTWRRGGLRGRAGPRVSSGAGAAGAAGAAGGQVGQTPLQGSGYGYRYERWPANPGALRVSIFLPPRSI